MRGLWKQRFDGGCAAALAALVVLVVAGSAAAQAKAGTAEVTRVTGQVEILGKGQAQWVPATVGAKLAERDEIRAFAGAWAEITLPDSSTLLLAENSRIVMTRLEFDRQAQTRHAIFHLVVGKVRAAIARATLGLVQARESTFAISTPTAVAAARGTVMIVSYVPAEHATFELSPDPASLEVTPEQLSRDESECERLAMVAGQVDRDRFHRCMASRRYAVQESKAQN